MHPALVDTDLIVTVGAAETVLHGGPAALIDACAAGVIRSDAAQSLLEPTGANGWQLATSLEAQLRQSVPVLGLSLVLDRPRTMGSTAATHGTPDAPRGRTLTGAQAPQRSPRALRRRLLGGVADGSSTSSLRSPALVCRARGGARPWHGGPPGVVDGPFETLIVPLPWEEPPGAS